VDQEDQGWFLHFADVPLFITFKSLVFILKNVFILDNKYENKEEGKGYYSTI